MPQTVVEIETGLKRCDIFTRVLIETPARMTEAPRKLLEGFRATETGEKCPASRNSSSG